MQNLFQKGFRYYVRLDANNQPVLGSLIARKKPPRDGGKWMDVTDCLVACCQTTTTTTTTTSSTTTTTTTV